MIKIDFIKIFSIMMSCVILFIVIAMVVCYYISNKLKNKLKSSRSKINKKYIKNKYGKMIDLMRGMSETRNITTGIIFINKDDATDIKLPYECLSPIKTHKSEDDIFVLDIDRNQYDHYIISDAYSKLSLYIMPSLFDLSRFYERYGKHIDDHDYHFLTLGYNITRDYKINQDLLNSTHSTVKLSASLKELINKHSLTSEALVGFYESLIKMKQLSYDEMIEELIRFEKSLKQMGRVDLVNNSEKINELFKTYNINESNQKNNITKIDEDLMKLTKK